MKDFGLLKTQIAAAIRENSSGAITGSVLQDQLLAIVGKMELSCFEGFATPSTTAVADTSGEHFYIAVTAGTYTNFGGTVLGSGDVYIFYRASGSSSWTAKQIAEGEVAVDDSTIGRNANGELMLKDGSVSLAKMTDAAKSNFATASQVTQLSLKVSNFDAAINDKDSAWDDAQQYAIYVGTNNAWKDGTTNYKCKAFSVKVGDEVKFTWGGTTSAYRGYRIISRVLPTIGSALDKTDDIATISNSGLLEETINVTEAGYLLVWHLYNGGSKHAPVAFSINDVDKLTGSIGLNGRVGDLEVEIRDTMFGYCKHDEELGVSDVTMKAVMDNLYSSSESSGINALKAKVNARTGLKIAIMSDTHHGGAYAKEWYNITAERSIDAFNRLTAITDYGCHLGDLSCDYGTSVHRLISYMRRVVEKIAPSCPMLITKGNHDEKNNGYREVSLYDVDWTNGEYYTRNFSEFTRVTESTWDGSALYEPYSELVTDSEFKKFAQKYHAPSSAVWGSGAYYYVDDSVHSVRIIVLNSFPVNDSRVVDETSEWTWFQSAINSVPTGYAVLCLRHTKSSDLSQYNNMVSAFTSAGGKYVATLHGHEHSYVYRNGASYNDIGVTMSNCKPSDFGDSTKYGLSVMTIDTTSRIVYIDRIDGQTDQYNY